MPVYSGIQLAVELTRVFPVQEIIQSGVSQAVSFARNLRKSGSDIVVEEDLADVFGRGRINVEVEKKFKDCVRPLHIKPLYEGSEIELRQGPGPTMHRALRDRRYFATVITISMLAFFTGRNELASMIDWCLDKRSQASGLDATNVSGSPGYEGILGTLATCSTQTGSFHWSSYRQMIEHKLRSTFPDYQDTPNYLKLTRTTLLGAMDFFYLVQSLPEDRRITVDDSTGCIILIIWAHIILGLNVAVRDSGNKIVHFGTGETHVLISWTTQIQDRVDSISGWSRESFTADCAIRLHEKDMTIIISCIPDPDQQRSFTTGVVQERVPLQGYGSVYLHRVLNTDIVIGDAHHVYEEIASLVTGLAIQASRNMRRATSSMFPYPRNQIDPPAPHIIIKLETWRVMSSAKMTFSGIPLDEEKVWMHSTFLQENLIDRATSPIIVASYFSRYVDKNIADRILGDLGPCICSLIDFVLLFAHVSELDKCGKLPLIMKESQVGVGHLAPDVVHCAFEVRPVVVNEIFLGIAALLASGSSSGMGITEMPGLHREWLYSDFGWSVYLSAAGNQDPSSVRPELVNLERGAPTHSKTNEQKLCCRDSFFSQASHLEMGPIQRTATYVPRSVARSTRCDHFWESRQQGFGLSIRTLHHTSQELRESSQGQVPEIVDYVDGYRAMHECLWNVWLTPFCSHAPISGHEPEALQNPTKLGPDAAAVLGWRTHEDLGVIEPEKVLILLTRNDPKLRWHAIQCASRSLGRHAMLRTDSCCDPCALEYAASLPGHWYLIL